MLEKRREEGIEILRIIACYMVIFNHSNDRGFLRFLYDVPGSIDYMVDIFAAIICKSAVPIFFMIAGTNLLKKEESIISTYKRIPRILVPFIVFSFLYFWIESQKFGQKFSVVSTLEMMLGGSYWHLWFLYAYIEFLIFLPILRKMVKGLEKESVVLMFILALIVMAVMPVGQRFKIDDINGNLQPLWMTSTIFIYPLMGYSIDYIFDKSKVKKSYLALLWVAVIIGIFVSAICEVLYLQREPGNARELFIRNFNILNSVTIFLTVRVWSQNRIFSQMQSKIICEIGKCTFGIYLLHIIFQWKIDPLFNFFTKIEQKMSLGVYLTCLLVFIISGVCTLILRRIPIVKKMF